MLTVKSIYVIIYLMQETKKLYRTGIVKSPPPFGAGVYAIMLNDEVLYVGSSGNFRKRLNHHRCQFINNKHINELLQQYYNRYSSDMYFQVLENTEELTLREIYFIKLLNPVCNIDISMDGLTFTASEATRIKQSFAKKGCNPWNKGIKRSEEDKKAMSQGIKMHNPNGRVPWNLGIPHSTETKFKISATKKGALRNV